MGMLEGEKRERRKQKFEAIMTENFPQINVRHQTTDPGSSENAKLSEHKTRHIIFKLWKNKDKEKILKEARGKRTPYL